MSASRGGALPSGKGRQSRTGSDHKGEAKRRDSDLTDIQMQYPVAESLPTVVDSQDAPAPDHRLYGEPQRQLPATYSHPSRDKKSFQFRQAVKASGVLAPPAGAGVLNWSPTDKELDIVEERWDELKNRDFEQWLSRTVDTRLPGRTDWLSKRFPEFIDKKVTALNRKLDLEMRLKLIENFGPDTREDFYLKYLVENGMLQDQNQGDDNYVAGFLAPEYRRGNFKGWFSNLFSLNAMTRGFANHTTQIPLQSWRRPGQAAYQPSGFFGQSGSQNVGTSMWPAHNALP